MSKTEDFYQAWKDSYTESRPPVQLTGTDGNAFAIIGACQRASRLAKWPSEKWNQVQAEMMTSDYENLLVVACKYFKVK